MAKSVLGIAKSENQAIRIANDLRTAGFSGNDISVLFPDKQGTRDFAHEQHTKAPEGATTGGITGGVIGGALGWLVGIGSLAIPGVGPFIAAGPILAALSGVAAGGAVGGIVGGLIGMGMPEYEAKRYEGKIREGNILISVHTENSDEVTRAKDIFKNAGAEDISYTGEESVKDGSRGESYVRSAEISSSQSYQAEPYSFYEPGFREDYSSMYSHSGRQYSDYEAAYRYGYMLATDPRYRDRDWDVIEPEARRDWAEYSHGRWEDFKDAVRRSWDRVRGWRSSASYQAEPYGFYEPSFREDFSSMYSRSGRQYSDYEAAYRYGYKLAMDPRYRDRDWVEIEPEARLGWTEYSQGRWEDFKDAVRRSWDRVREQRSPASTL